MINNQSIFEAIDCECLSTFGSLFVAIILILVYENHRMLAVIIQQGRLVGTFVAFTQFVFM